jgi:uncharacterized protein (TIGR02466 family)
MIQHLFSTPVYFNTLASENIQAISKEINDVLPLIRQKNLDNPWYDNVKTTFKYGEGTNDLGEYNLNLLQDALFNHVRIYLRELGLQKECTISIVESWFNFGERGAHQTAHRHALSTISVVYYHQTNEHDGNICFLSPCAAHNLFPLWQLTEAINTKSDVIYSPQVGKMLVFPSYLVHSVHENKTNHERISIAVNFLVKNKEE